MLKSQVFAGVAAVCLIFAVSPLSADTVGVVIDYTHLDFQDFVPEPEFDWDESPVHFKPKNDQQTYLGATDSDDTWFFRGTVEYTGDYSEGNARTWFLRTSDVRYLEIDKDVVNTSEHQFNGYTITLENALYVQDSLAITGVGYTMDVEETADTWGNVNTTISIVFDEAVAVGDTFHLTYLVDIDHIEVVDPPSDPGFGVGDGGDPGVPEPGTLAMLAMGTALLVQRRRRRNS